jgi:hypothetical protein
MQVSCKGLMALMLSVFIFAAQAATVNLSHHATGEGWQKFSAALVEDGLMKPGDDKFDTRGVSNVTYNALSDAQKASMGRDAYHRLQLLYLPPEIKVADWPRIAGNIQLPDVRVVAQAQPAAPAATAPAAPAQILPPPATNTVAERDGLVRTLTILNGKVEALEKRSDQSAEVEALRRELRQLNERLSKAATGDDLKGIRNDLQKFIDGAFAGLVLEVNNLKDRIDDPKIGLAAAHKAADDVAKSVNDPETGLAATHMAAKEALAAAEAAKSAVSPWMWWVSLIGVLVAIAISLFAAARKRGFSKQDEETVATLVSGEVSKVVGLNTTAFNKRFSQVEAKVLEAQKVAEAAHKAVTGNGAYIDVDKETVEKALATVASGKPALLQFGARNWGQDLGTFKVVLVPNPKAKGYTLVKGVKQLEGDNVRGVSVKRANFMAALSGAVSDGRLTGLTDEKVGEYMKSSGFVDTVVDDQSAQSANRTGDPLTDLNAALTDSDVPAFLLRDAEPTTAAA